MELAAAAAINKINVKFFMTLFFCKNNSIPKLFTIEFLPHKFVRDTKGKHRKKQDMQREPKTRKVLKINNFQNFSFMFKIRTPSGIRTLDPLIKSQLLYQLS